MVFPLLFSQMEVGGREPRAIKLVLGDARNGGQAIADASVLGVYALDAHGAPSISVSVVGLCDLHESVVASQLRRVSFHEVFRCLGFLPEGSSRVSFSWNLHLVGLSDRKSVV